MKPHHRTALILAALLGNSVASGVANAESWALQFVDTGSNSGAATSLGLSEEGFPVIAYHSGTGRKLRYAALDSGDKIWHIQIVDDGGEFTSLGVDSTGIVHVAYNDALTLQLKYWRKNQTQTSTQFIDQSSGKGGFSYYNSLKVDRQGVPHVSYYDLRNPDGSVSDDLKYAYLSGAGWVPQTIDGNQERGKYNSLALDANGNPQISYFDNSGKLRYAKRSPGSGAWSTEAVDTLYDSGRFNSIQVDAAGLPHISYTALATSQLRYAHFDGVQWTIEIVDGIGAIYNGSVTSLTLDRQGDPHISYYDSALHALKYASRKTGVWTVEVVDASGDVGWYSSLLLDAADRPVISYYDATTRALKIAYGNYPDGDGDGIPDAFDSCPTDADCNGNGRLDGQEGGVLLAASGGTGPARLVGDDSFFGCGSIAAFGAGPRGPGGPGGMDLLFLLVPAAYVIARRVRATRAI